MRLYCLIFLFAAILVVEGDHRFVGTNVLRPMVYHHRAQYSSMIFRKRVENLYFALPALPTNVGRVIQGILAYDVTNSGASANITQGGIGFNFVNLRMKSDRGKSLDYDIFVYA